MSSRAAEAQNRQRFVELAPLQGIKGSCDSGPAAIEIVIDQSTVIRVSRGFDVTTLRDVISLPPSTALG